MTSHRPTRAFTLVELLVVVAILAILSGIIIPAVVRVREKGWSAYCVNNLRQIGLCIQLYGDQYSGFFPVVHMGTYAAPVPGSQAWWELLLPHSIKRENLLCPRDPWGKSAPLISYIMNGMFEFSKKQVTVQASSSRILLSERSEDVAVLLVASDYPAWEQLTVWRPFVKQDRHMNVSNYLYGDSHVFPAAFSTTIGQDQGDGYRNETNQHYVVEFVDPP